MARNNQKLNLTIKTEWMPYFIGKRGSRAQYYKSKYSLITYNIQPVIDEQGYKTGIIYLKGDKAALALIELKQDMLRLKGMDNQGHHTTNYETSHMSYQSIEEDSTTIEPKIPQRVPSNSEDSFPSLPVKKNNASKYIQEIESLHSLIEEQRQTIEKLKFDNKSMVETINMKRKNTNKTLQINGIPHKRKTGEDIVLGDMYSTLSKSAKITSITLEETNEDTQTCYVTFTTNSDAEMIMKFLNGNVIEGGVMDVSYLD